MQKVPHKKRPVFTVERLRGKKRQVARKTFSLLIEDVVYSELYQQEAYILCPSN